MEIVHGKLSTYNNHKCRCIECRAAQAEYHRNRSHKNTGRTCRAESCERPFYAKGFCKTHYQQLRIHGSTQPILAGKETIYAIREGSKGPIKIGIAVDPSKRLGNLQHGNPRTLKVIATRQGTTRDEATIHQRLKEHRLVGEWFRNHPDVVAEIESWYGL
jgi:hypothetical protein